MWHQRVKDKFKNSRKRGDRNQPEVVKRLAVSTSSSNKATRNVWGLVNFIPDRNAADSDDTIETFVKQLQVPVVQVVMLYLVNNTADSRYNGQIILL